MISDRELVLSSGLFDPEFYAAINPEVLVDDIDPLEHYLAKGWRQARLPSVDFDAPVYLKNNADVRAAGWDPLLHFLKHGRTEGRDAPALPLKMTDLPRATELIAGSGLFDHEFYLDRSPLIREAGIEPVRHYLLGGYLDHVEINPEVSLVGYWGETPFCRAARWNPLLHYLEFGRRKGRSLRRSVQDAIWTQEGFRKPSPDGAVHFEVCAGISFFRRFGLGESTRRLARACDEVAARRPDLEIAPIAPDVSIIVPVYGQTAYVLNCLDSLARQRSRYSVEILILDDASPDAAQVHLIQSIPWVRYHRRPENAGFVVTCNEAAELARGRHLVFLNSDTRVAQSWLDELIGTFETFPACGLVGSKLYNEDGSLQEAGAIVWRDGSAWNYGRDCDPGDPRFSFARRVDYCSGAAIAVPAELWRRLGGFDLAFKPAYAEDADLAFRIREAGHEVWFQPLARVLHYEGKTHGRDTNAGVKAHQIRNLLLLKERWGATLLSHSPPDREVSEEANRAVSEHILVIDAATPTPDKDSGSYITSKMIDAYRELGYGVVFAPQHGFEFSGAYTEALQRRGVECMYNPYISQISGALERPSNFEAALVYRHNVFSEVYPMLRGERPSVPIILHTVDLHHARERRRAELIGSRSGLRQAKITQGQELKAAVLADCVIVHTPVEASLIKHEVPLENILEFPYVVETRRGTPGFDDRHDLMFLGGFAHPPNVDGIHFFVSEIWPLLVDALPSGARLAIVGADPPASVQALAGERVVITGQVKDLAPEFDRTRIFVAPLRYGAGIKGKVIQSLAHGVPVVATNTASEGIGLEGGQNCMIADTPEEFAAKVLSLYGDRALWTSIQQNALRLVEAELGWGRCLELCSQALNIAHLHWTNRQDSTRKRHLLELLGLEQLTHACE